MIHSSLPIYNQASFLQAKGASPLRCSVSSSFTTEQSSLKPVNVSTREHLSNLDKFLQKSFQDSQPPDSRKGSSENSRKGFLHGLNLAKIWQAAAEEEESDEISEISTQHLKNMQSLLSTSPENNSPRNFIGDRWEDFHGGHDWCGLVDPLDEDLRREVVRYGEFIQAAYQSFISNPATSMDEDPEELTHLITLPDTSYKVTKTLYTTSSVGFPNWVDEVAPNLGWMTQRSSKIGYVAVCNDKKEIERMGRRDIVIALRGTCTCLEWAENMRDLLVSIAPERNDNNITNRQAKVQCGFLSLCKTSGAQIPSLSESVLQEVERLVELYKGEHLSITLTGHSLGAALAILVANELSTSLANLPRTAVLSFGGPRVGNRAFKKCIESNNVKVLRIVNSQDVITRVPGMFVNEDIDRELRKTIPEELLNVLDDNMPWAYSHVGTELRVNTRMSPYLKPDADVACCHDLEAYLHLVDGFIASNCPFRANAKRSLVKLLNEQRSNMKKLYTRKAKTLKAVDNQTDVMRVSSCRQVHHDY